MKAEPHAVPLLVAVVVLAQAVLSTPAAADWPPNGLGVCTDPAEQTQPAVAPDGAGGAYIAWDDHRTSNPGIYIQRVTAEGEIAPGWPADGRFLVSGSNPSLAPAPDGDVYVAWADSIIVLQRLTPEGGIATGWPSAGLVLADTYPWLELPFVVADGLGGAIVAWNSSNTSNHHAQRVAGDGTLAAGWPAGGVAVTQLGGSFELPQLASDGLGGAIVAWGDIGSGNITASRIVDGAIAPGWPVTGLTVCDAAGSQNNARIAADGAGGATIAWRDGRDSGTSGVDLYLQRITGAGAPVAGWPANGVGVCTLAGDQQVTAMVADGSGGTIVSWIDRRSDPGGDIYAQRLTGAAEVAPGWPTNGAVVTTIGLPGFFRAMVPDDDGGALVAWADLRDFATNAADLYVQHLAADGAVVDGWPAGGVPLSTAPGEQTLPRMVPNGAGGAIVAWVDSRLGPTNHDVYAARINPDGSTPVLAALVSAEATAGRVRLHWHLPGGAGAGVQLERRTAADDWRGIASLIADGTGDVRFEDRDVIAGARVGYRLRAGAAEEWLGEVWIDVPAAHAFGLRASHPGGDVIRVAFTLPEGGLARLDLFDIGGRNLLTRTVEASSAGARVLDLAPEWPLRAGVHLVRLVLGDRAVVARTIVVR